ncbi:MAG: DUF721 domain-containing protein [Prochlorothrix sp.]|nr:DUF721 domain-containing protein [Prochlorothrix sp.]
MKRNAFQTLDSILGKMRQQANWQAPQAFQQVVQVWPTIVGTAVAAQTRPVRLERQLLQVATATSVWAQHLQFERHHIMAKLKADLGLDLREIRFSSALWSVAPYPDRHNLASVEQQALWQRHPSRIHPPAPPLAPLGTPVASFVDCPQCNCPTPPGEIQRWSVCAFCMARSRSQP